MKKIIVLILVTFTLFSCGEEIEFNTPSFQAEKDGNIWEAVTYRANINSLGVLTITASDNFEIITLEVNSASIGLFDVAETTSSGSLFDINEVLFSSNNFPDPTIQLYPASGVIELLEVDLEKGYVSGEFYFNAFNTSGLSSVNVNKGFFHRVPLIGAEVVDPDVVGVTCAAATAGAAATLINFSALSPGDANYVTTCNAYKTALTTKKLSCGDADNAIQTIIDSLNCM